METTDWAKYIVDNNVWFFSFAAVAGAIFHYWKAKYKKQIGDTFVEYWFMKETGHSLGTVGVLWGTISTAVAAHVLDGASASAIIMLGWSLGFAADSGLNKGTPHGNKVPVSITVQGGGK